jgi:hypothetical protein
MLPVALDPEEIAEIGATDNANDATVMTVVVLAGL